MSKKGNEKQELLEKKLKKHWEDTKEEREKTHTTRLSQKLKKKRESK